MNNLYANNISAYDKSVYVRASLTQETCTWRETYVKPQVKKETVVTEEQWQDTFDANEEALAAMAHRALCRKRRGLGMPLDFAVD